MNRDEFRESVFKRDKHNCVWCGYVAKDAHHIMERRLFPDGGYDINNGASLCDYCHLRAESTVLTCDEIRQCAGITEVVLPPHLYPDERYDKWGNVYLQDGTRLRGELYYDESVQKIIKGTFSQYVKYPRTYHLPWSPGVTKDDRIMESLAGFEGEQVIISVKMDGENTTVYSDGYVHARSIEYTPHPSRNLMKAKAAEFAYNLPEGWRVCGENLYAKHSIFYDDLVDYFQVFSIWNERNECLSWDNTIEWCKLLGITSVADTVSLELPWEDFVANNMADYLDVAGPGQEGYVVRVARSFSYGEFRRVVGKYVRAHHVDPANHHWMFEKVVPNELRK